MALGAWRAVLLLGLLGVSPGHAQADDVAGPPAPLGVRDQNPFIQVYGLPAFEPAELTPAGHVQFQAAFDLTNNSKLADSASESISLDGETYRLAFSVRFGLSDQLEAGIEIPLVFQRGGLLDDFIIGWHELLGLPTGERNAMPINQLDYSHRFQGQESIAVRSDQQGLGDVRLFAATRLYGAEDGPRELSLHASLELPTGDSSQLMGSGSTDLSLSLNGVERGMGSCGITWFGRLGLLASSESDVLAARQRQAVAFGGFGLSWRAVSRLDLKAQLDVHGSFYESELPQLAASSVLLTVGGTIHFGPATSLDLAVGENLFIDTIPDVTFTIALSHRR